MLKRTPLHRYTPLKAYTQLKTHKRLKPMSEKAKKELDIWLKVKALRIQKLRAEFGFLICEYCLGSINSDSDADAHHNDHDRRNNCLANARICHAYCNRVLIEDRNVKNVPSLLREGE